MWPYFFKNLLLYPWVQSLKRSTFPFVAFAHLPFSVHSSCVYRSFTVHSSFTVLCSPFSVSLTFNVHKAFIVRSLFFQLPFTKLHRLLIVLNVFRHFHSELQRERIVLKPNVHNSDKIRRNVCRRMGENVLCILEISLLITKHQDY